MKKQIKQLGQGMTEYIIIIALIAIAGIGAFTFFGDGLKKTVGNVTSEFTGGKAVISKDVLDAGQLNRDMSDFSTTDK